MVELSKFKKSKFYVFWSCTGWVRIATLICLSDTLFCILGHHFFPQINIWWFLGQWIVGISFYVYIIAEMIYFYKKRRKMYLYVRGLLEKEEDIPQYISYQFGTRCERSCLRSLERDFKVKFL